MRCTGSATPRTALESAIGKNQKIFWFRNSEFFLILNLPYLELESDRQNTWTSFAEDRYRDGVSSCRKKLVNALFCVHSVFKSPTGVASWLENSSSDSGKFEQKRVTRKRISIRNALALNARGFTEHPRRERSQSIFGNRNKNRPNWWYC